MSFVDTFFNNYSSTSAEGAAGGYVNRVYLGAGETTRARGTIRGRKIDATGSMDNTKSIIEAKRMYLTDEKLRNQWNVLLRKNGLDADPIQARAIWELSVDGASDWYATSQGEQKITPQQYLTWYATGKTSGKAPKADLTRQVYQYSPEQIDADINDVAFKVLGREITDQDKSADWYKELTGAINKMVSKGTTTEVKQVRNPKTGKLEQVVTQTPRFTKEKAEAAITEAVEAADPESLARKERLDFTKWLYSQKGTQG